MNVGMINYTTRGTHPTRREGIKMTKLKLGYATKNRENERFLYDSKNVVRMEDAPDGQTIVFAFKHVPRSDSPNFIWYSDPRPCGYVVSPGMLRLIGE